MARRSCPVCGSTFEVSASRAKWGRGKHCSPACQYEARRRQPKRLVQLNCVGCGKSFSMNPSSLKAGAGAGKYCSRACRDKYRVGPLHPQWIDETTHGPRYYGANWQAQKRRAKRRDRSCRNCGSTKLLHVHHIIPIRLWETKEQANALSNLVTLCAACHRKVEAASQWVELGDGAGVIQYATGGPIHELARERCSGWGKVHKSEPEPDAPPERRQLALFGGSQ